MEVVQQSIEAVAHFLQLPPSLVGFVPLAVVVVTLLRSSIEKFGYLAQYGLNAVICGLLIYSQRSEVQNWTVAGLAMWAIVAIGCLALQKGAVLLPETGPLSMLRVLLENNGIAKVIKNGHGDTGAPPTPPANEGGFMRTKLIVITLLIVTALAAVAIVTARPAKAEGSAWYDPQRGELGVGIDHEWLGLNQDQWKVGVFGGWALVEPKDPLRPSWFNTTLVGSARYGTKFHDHEYTLGLRVSLWRGSDNPAPTFVPR